MKKLLALLLAGMMTVAMIACSQSGNSEDTTATAPNITTGGSDEDPLYADPNLPAQNFGRDVVFLSREDWAFREVGMEEDSSEVVAATVYARDLYLEGKYGVDLKLLTKANSEIATYAIEMFSNDLTFDVILAGFATTFSMLQNGVLLDMDDVPNINIEKAYWNQAILKNTSIAGKNYMLVSATNLQTLHAASCVFVNTNLYNELYESGVYNKDIYDIVRDEEWTIDKMTEISQLAYHDVDGSSTPTVGDRFGSCSSLAACEGMFSGMGGMYVTKDAEDIPEYLGITESLTDIITKVISFWADDTALLINRYTNSDEVYVQTISNGNLLFMQEQMYQYGAFSRYCDYPVGILPMPKYNEAQENYYTFTHVNWSSATSIPITLSEEFVAQVGAILEDMAYLSQRDVFPAYYELNLKVRNAEGDADSIEMLDLMFETLNVDLGNVLVSTGLDAMYVLRDLVSKKSTDITSTFGEKEPIYAAVLDKLLRVVSAG